MGKKDKEAARQATAEVAAKVRDDLETRMAQPALIEASIAEHEQWAGPPQRHQHRSVEEQVGFLRTELGRLKRRLRELEAGHRAHRHPETSPPVRYGVHIDQRGHYWMRRPDGFHGMVIMARTGTPAGQAHRLSEDKS